jgi:hypothetical protein
LSALRKPTLKSYADVFTLDDITVFAFDKCQSGEFRYINKDQKIRETDIDNWATVYDAFVAKFGQSSDFEMLIKIKHKLTKLKLEFCITADVALLDYIKILEQDLKNRMKGEKMTYSDALVLLSKFVGYRLNPREVTILEFKSLEQHYGRNNKKE